jgi:hypothetical protein
VGDRRTIVFFPEGAYGPTSNCAGIGAVLRARGHRVVSIVEESFAGSLEEKGFEERLMRLGPPPAERGARHPQPDAGATRCPVGGSPSITPRSACCITAQTDALGSRMLP